MSITKPYLAASPCSPPPCPWFGAFGYAAPRSASRTSCSCAATRKSPCPLSTLKINVQQLSQSLPLLLELLPFLHHVVNAAVLHLQHLQISSLFFYTFSKVKLCPADACSLSPKSDGSPGSIGNPSFGALAPRFDDHVPLFIDQNALYPQCISSKLKLIYQN